MPRSVAPIRGRYAGVSLLLAPEPPASRQSAREELLAREPNDRPRGREIARADEGRGDRRRELGRLRRPPLARAALAGRLYDGCQESSVNPRIIDVHQFVDVCRHKLFSRREEDVVPARARVEEYGFSAIF